MIVDYLILADAAHADVDKHHILGAGWDALYAGDDSYRLNQMAAAVRVQFEDGDGDAAHVEFDICDDEGTSVLPSSLAGQVWWQLRTRMGQTGPKRAYLAFTVSQVELGRPGTFHAVIRSAGEELARETFAVVPLEATWTPTNSEAEAPETQTAPSGSAGPPDEVRVWSPKS